MMNVSLQRGLVCFALSLPSNTLSDTLQGINEYLLKSENPNLSPNLALTLLPGHIHLPAKACVSSSAILHFGMICCVFALQSSVFPGKL